MTPSDLAQIVRHLALPEGTKFVAMSRYGNIYAHYEKPTEDTRCTGVLRMWAKPQPNWRELCISVEGE